MSDEYVTLSVFLHRKTKAAICVSRDADATDGVWIPRSCLHAATDLALADAELDEEIEIKVREWIAQREGLV